jgi:FkbM family methyltransferase
MAKSKFARMRQENSLGTTLTFYLRRKFKIRSVMEVKVHGEMVSLRTYGPDFAVAYESLGGEFDCLRSAFPTDHAGLIVDAGGFIGTAAIAFARMYPKATIVTIEPSTANFELLKKNTTSFRNIVPFKGALVPDGAPKKMQLFDKATSSVAFTLVKPDDAQGSVLEEVDTTSIESILAERGVDQVDICKMDIEGAEYELFQKPGWLDRVRVLMIELHEGVVAGCERAFFNACARRFVTKSPGEKWITVGRNFFGAAGQ